MTTDTFDIAEVEAIDQGIYPAVLKKIERKEIETGQYAGNTIRIWTFEVDVNGTAQKVTDSSSLNTGPRSKAFAWLTSLLNRTPIPGEKGLNPVGLPCRVHLVTNEDGYNKIAAVLPAEKGQKAAAPASAAAGAIDDDLPDLPLEEPPQYNRDDLP